jgi:hypothetical protein
LRIPVVAVATMVVLLFIHISGAVGGGLRVVASCDATIAAMASRNASGRVFQLATILASAGHAAPELCVPFSVPWESAPSLGF